MRILSILLLCLISIGCKTLSDKHMAVFGAQSFYVGCKLGTISKTTKLEDFGKEDKCEIGAKIYGNVVFDNVEILRKELEKFE